MKYVVDMSLINRLVDGCVTASELPRDGAFVATHIQRDELERTKNKERRRTLLEKFSEVIEESLPTETFVLDVSRLDDAKLGTGDTFKTIKKELDLRNKNKPNNINDALIAEVAQKHGYALLTANYGLYQVAHAEGIAVVYWTS